jgi:hypothetical protein
MPDDTESNPQPAAAPSPADVPEPQPWEVERARQNLLDLMLDGRSTGGQRHFVTGDGVVSWLSGLTPPGGPMLLGIAS